AVGRGHQGVIWNLAFAPDGKTVASASADGTVRLWDAATAQQRGLLQHPQGAHLRGIGYSPDGKLLATGALDGTVRLWDTGSLQQRAVLQRHTALVFSARFSPDGKTLATACGDETAILWDVTPALAPNRVAQAAPAAQ